MKSPSLPVALERPDDAAQYRFHADADFAARETWRLAPFNLVGQQRPQLFEVARCEAAVEITYDVYV
jgi:hypothetical protein